MISAKGKAYNIDSIIIGKLDTDINNKKSGVILLTDSKEQVQIALSTVLYVGVMTENEIPDVKVPMLVLEKKWQQVFASKDIVIIYPNGTCILEYKECWHDLTIFFTNDCNSNCIMCPQTENEEHGAFVEINNRILDLAPDGLEYMGITGGEPTLYEGELLSLMAKVHRTYPNLPISLLTNGRRFQDINLVRRMSAIGHKKLMACIPLYAANHAQHDRIVGRNGAFVETLRGIFNLYQAGILVEIRIVIGRFNNLWLQDISEFLLRNLPFVRHIAFMGMEYTGNALKNHDEIVIDPYDYRNELDQATWRLHRRGMNLSIYNIPLCLLERRSWIFARDSISAWKKEYVEKCENCQQRTKCCGLFATSNYISGNLHTL